MSFVFDDKGLKPHHKIISNVDNSLTATDNRLPIELWDAIFRSLIIRDHLDIGTEWQPCDPFNLQHMDVYQTFPDDPVLHLRALRMVSKLWNEIISRISCEWIQILNFRSTESILKYRNQHPYANLFTKRIDLIFSPFPPERPLLNFPSEIESSKAISNLAEIFKQSIHLKVFVVFYRHDYLDANDEHPNSWICDLLNLLPNIHSLDVIRFICQMPCHTQAFLKMLPSLSNLRFLTMVTPYTGSVPPPHLPNLDTLWIHIGASSLTTEWLKEWKLPSLRHLIAISASPTSPDHVLALLENNGEKLLSLSATTYFSPGLPLSLDLWRLCPTLHTIQLHTLDLHPCFTADRESITILFIDREYLSMPETEVFPFYLYWRIKRMSPSRHQGKGEIIFCFKYLTWIDTLGHEPKLRSSELLALVKPRDWILRDCNGVTLQEWVDDLW